MEVPLTPLALAERAFQVYGDRCAVLDEEGTLTYRELEARVTRLAGALRMLGVHRGDAVALLAPNTAAGLECYTGVPLAGAVLVPMNTRLHPDDYGYILDHAGIRCLVADASLLDRVQPVLSHFPRLVVVVMGGEPQAGRLDYEELLAAATPLPMDAGPVDERGIITLNYTSGTTARPKGVAITHRGAWTNAVNMVFALGLRREDTHLHVAPMFHANGWGFVWATLGVGAGNVPLPRVQGPQILRRVARFGVSTLCAAPTVLGMILDAAAAHDQPLPRGVRVGSGGGAPPAAVIRRLEEELGWSVVHMYGLTETTAFVTYCEPPADLGARTADDRARFTARQGIPLLLSGRVRVVHRDGSAVRGDGQDTGEVLARGNVVMAGYHRDESATAEALQDGWFHTGDLAVVHPDGYLEIRDRLKDVIKTGGEQVPSVEVEGALADHPGVGEVAVVAGPHPHWQETPVAFVVPRPGARPGAQELTAFLRERLAHFKIPTRYEFVAELPRTASGKVRKEVLRRRLREAWRGQGPEPPSSSP